MATPSQPKNHTLTKITTLPGHTDRVWCCAWSPGGTALATCSSDKTIRVWKKSSKLGPHDITRAQLSENSANHVPALFGSIYAQGVQDSLLKDTVNNSLVECTFELSQNDENDGNITSLNDWECMQVLENCHTRTIRSISWSPSGRHIAAASFDHSVSIWELIDGQFELVATLRGHENEVKSVNWSQSGERLVTSSRDKTVWVWETDGSDGWECTSVLTGHSGDVKKVSFHPHSDDVISCSYDDTLRVWQIQDDDWYNSITLADGASTVWDFNFTKNAKFLTTVSDDHNLRIYSHDPAQPIPKQWKYLINAPIAQRTVFSVSVSNQFFPPRTHTSQIPDDALSANKYTIYAMKSENCGQLKYFIGLAPCFGFIATGSGDNDVNIAEMVREIDETVLKQSNHPQISLDNVIHINSAQFAPIRLPQYQKPKELLPPDEVGNAEEDSTSDPAEQGKSTPTTPQAQTIDEIINPLTTTISGLITTLTVHNAHLSDVNCVAWNPKIGNILATVGDDNEIILWRLSRD